MLVKDLIKQLEKIIEDNKAHEHIMGEADIVIDVFRKREIVHDEKKMHHLFEYSGFSPNIKIEWSADGVYPILSAFEGDKDETIGVS